MDDRPPVPMLNAILPRLARSLAVYLADARPWISPRHERLRPALAALVADHRMYADRLAAMILDLGGQPDLGRFPTAYTDLHDVAAEFLLDRLVCELRADLSAADRAADQLPEGSPARQLADEIRGNLQGHLDIWEGLAR
jgi:hypothetical protein